MTHIREEERRSELLTEQGKKNAICLIVFVFFCLIFMSFVKINQKNIKQLNKLHYVLQSLMFVWW